MPILKIQILQIGMEALHIIAQRQDRDRTPIRRLIGQELCQVFERLAGLLARISIFLFRVNRDPRAVGRFCYRQKSLVSKDWSGGHVCSGRTTR